MTVAVVGAGLVGTFVGVHLSSQTPVVLVGRSKEWQDRLHGQTLVAQTLSKTTQTLQNPKTCIALDTLEQVETYIICVKRLVLREAADALLSSLKKPGKVVLVTLMNGVGACEELSKIVKEKQLTGFEFEFVEGIWSTNIVEKEPLLWSEGSSGACYLDQTPSSIKLAAMLNKSGIHTETTENIIGVQYGKLLVNLNNPISALSGLPTKQELLGPDSGYRVLLAHCMWEALNVYERSGITPISTTRAPAWFVPKVLYYTPTFVLNQFSHLIVNVEETATSSMYEDLKAKRMTEIQYLQGEIVRLANQTDQPVPYCQGILELVQEPNVKR
ncbi:ketopantoate reductase PanE/ApbA C terminal-domain-containing protein [Gorgonomyces haynaldii]|nr:ketopantoate reductase PanE/ApbA C terminal-domain-containing protein [Gorgonomyces haynaldii]